MSDEKLIERARRGEESAIRMLYERHSARVYAVVRRLAGDDSLAEDWAQETWVQAIRSLPSFRGDAQFSTWLHRVAVNCALQGLRRRSRRERREEAIRPALQLTTGAGQGERLVLRHRLERALRQLPERMRQVLILHDVEGYTHQEIGEALGVAPGTSKSQLFKARARMRELLQPVAAAANGD